MSVETKNKKKKTVVEIQQEQEQEKELPGSRQYLETREVDIIIKKGRDKLKHAIHASVEKLTKTKKQIVKEMAIELEKVGYPVDQICYRLTQSLKPLVSDTTVSDALADKYKDLDQSRRAKMRQSPAGSEVRSLQQKVREKDVMELTEQDIKNIKDLTTARKIIRNLIGKARLLEQQLKQVSEINRIMETTVEKRLKEMEEEEEGEANKEK